MTLSQDFAICPWCGHEDSTWPEYHTAKLGIKEPVRQIEKIVCNSCKKPYQAIMTIEFYKSPVCEHDKKQFGDYIEHPICCFETRKIVLRKQQEDRICPNWRICTEATKLLCTHNKPHIYYPPGCDATCFRSDGTCIQIPGEEDVFDCGCESCVRKQRQIVNERHK